MKFNINHKVKIKLTDYGRRVLKRDHEEFWGQLNIMNPKVKIPEYTPIKEDKDGWSEWQLWHLMEQLGKYAGMGNKNVFETNILIMEK